MARTSARSSRDDELCGVRGRRRADVGDEIRQSRVHLVSDCADDGHTDAGDTADDPLVVERHQVFVRAAATTDDHDVEPGVPFEPIERRHDALRREVPLYEGR
jgi:hypothetical protein